MRDRGKPGTGSLLMVQGNFRGTHSGFGWGRRGVGISEELGWGKEIKRPALLTVNILGGAVEKPQKEEETKPAEQPFSELREGKSTCCVLYLSSSLFL